jgi:hypothetical protein
LYYSIYINGYIFNNIEQYNYIKDHIGLYNYSFLSYYYITTPNNRYWDYNKLIFKKEHYILQPDNNIYSPYNPIEFNKLVTNINCNNNCYRRGFVYVGVAIKHISFYDIFFIATHKSIIDIKKKKIY